MNSLRLAASSCITTYDAVGSVTSQIAGQSTESAKLPIQSNPAPSIRRLANETLEVIFFHYVYDCYYRDFGRPIRPMPRWVNVTYVCRRWRHVALNYPPLWSHLTVMSLRWKEAFLVRSEQQPLNVLVNLDRQDRKRLGLRFAEDVMNHIGRIRELHLHIPRRHGGQLLAKCRLPALSLEQLKISILAASSPEWPEWVLFDGDTPFLRTLELSECRIQWSSFRSRALTSLTLHGGSFSFLESTRVYLEALICIKHLYLIDTYICDLPSDQDEEDDTTERDTLQKTNLPQLSHLLIVAPLSTTVAFLSAVDIPLEAQVRLECRSDIDYHPDKYAEFCSLITSRFGTSAGQAQSYPTIRSFVVAASAEQGGAKLTFSTTSDRNCEPFASPSFTDWYWDCDIPLQVVVHPDRLTMASGLDGILSNISCAVPLTSVENVHVIGPLFSSAFWRKPLGRLRALRYLKLSHGVMPDLVSLFSHSPCSFGEDNVKRVHGRVASGLEDLELYDIVFSTAPGNNMYPHAVDVGTLCDVLATRCAPRGRLTVTQCTELDSDDEEELEVAGGWEGGRFHINQSDSETTRISIHRLP